MTIATAVAVVAATAAAGTSRPAIGAADVGNKSGSSGVTEKEGVHTAPTTKSAPNRGSLYRHLALSRVHMSD